MNNHQPVRLSGKSSRRLLFAAISLVALAAIVAFELRQYLDKRHDTLLLFPGFTADAAPEPDTGLVVTSLQSGSEAQLDGIAVGDAVLAIDNHPVESLDQARKIIGSRSRDGLVLRVLHNDRPRDFALHGNGVKRHEP